ncbi:MAG: endonuclease/exonuclease/phosphatase family protein [Coraliomargaritaceae bacterium]
MNRLGSCFLLLLFLLRPYHLSASEYTAVAYNVENLFDLDECSLFEDYRLGTGKPFAYSRFQLLTKLQNIVRVLSAFNDGEGPDIILFQELEGDLTPESGMGQPEEFLNRYRETSVEAMLTSDWNPQYAGLPAQAWLLKAMYDAGLRGYAIACPPAETEPGGIAHVNALFSRFPITTAEYHSIPRARAIIEATLEIDGHPLYVYVNHWKSGASNPQREPIRVANAHVLKDLIDQRLDKDPQADIIIGGDLNSHYNQAALFPDLRITGINHILDSQGNEEAVRKADGPALYNLWYELPPEQRYSDVWRGKCGSLMHLIVSRGLYDRKGIAYVDNSFDKFAEIGLNADALGRPFRWSFAGRRGGGFSDHFPVYARFSLAPVEFLKPASFGPVPAFAFPLPHDAAKDLHPMDGSFLSQVADADLDPYLGVFYSVSGRITSLRPLCIQVDGVHWPAYVPDPELFARLSEGQSENWVVRIGIWKGRRQFIVEGIR